MHLKKKNMLEKKEELKQIFNATSIVYFLVTSNSFLDSFLMIIIFHKLQEQPRKK
jgi:hypothetical protein